MRLYRQLFDSRDTDLPLMDIARRPRPSRGLSHHLTQALKGTALLGAGVAGFWGLSWLWKGKSQGSDTSESTLSSGLQEDLAPRRAESMTHYGMAETGLPLSSTPQAIAQAQDGHDVSTTRRHLSSSQSHRRSFTTRALQTVSSFDEKEDALALNYREQKVSPVLKSQMTDSASSRRAIVTVDGACNEFQINTYTTDKQQTPSVAGLADGGFVVTWSGYTQDGDASGVYGQRYNAAGALTGSEFQVNSYTAGSQTSPSVAALTGGGFVVTWRSAGDGSSYGIYGQRYNTTGGPVGAEFQINTYTTNSQTTPSVVALSNGGFVVAWESSGQDGNATGVYGQRFNATGGQAGTEFQVNTYTTGTQQFSSVTALSNGGFVVAWESSWQDGNATGIYGQRYNATGGQVGTEFQINTYTTNDQGNPSVATLSNGGFVVVWDSTEQDSSFGGIYGQRYNTTGGQANGEFQVNTYTTNRQSRPSVAVLPNGDFVVTWDSYGQDGDQYGIYGQRYNAAGTGVGGEFQVSTYTTSRQRYASVAALSSGGVVVTWESLGQDGDNYGIYGRLSAPCLASNRLTIHEGQTTPLNTTYLGATTMAPFDASLVFTIQNIQQGLFDRASSPGTPITTFTQEEVKNGQIRFVHDGGEIAPSYDIKVSDGSFETSSQPANITFISINDPPVLVNNRLIIRNGGKIALDSTMLSAMDSDTEDVALLFMLKDIKRGFFENIAQNRLVTNFTQQAITNKDIFFVHDGTNIAPFYQVKVSDGKFETNYSSAQITFLPELDPLLPLYIALGVAGSGVAILAGGGSIVVGAYGLSQYKANIARKSLVAQEMLRSEASFYYEDFERDFVKDVELLTKIAGPKKSAFLPVDWYIYRPTLICLKGQPTTDDKDIGFYLYREKNSETVSVLVVHSKSLNETLNLTKILKEREKEALLSNIDWPQGLNLTTKLNDEIVGAIISNCEHHIFNNAEEIITIISEEGGEPQIIIRETIVETGEDDLVDAGEQRLSTTSPITISGLRYVPVPKDHHCVYRAVSLSLNQGEDVSWLRQLVAANIAANKEVYRPLIALPEGRSLEGYIEAAKSSTQWAGDLEINVLMRLLDRPIVIIGPEKNILNPDAVTKFQGKEPIFLYFDNINHYGAMLLSDTQSDARKILDNLMQQEEEQKKASQSLTPEEQQRQVFSALKKAGESHQYLESLLEREGEDEKRRIVDNYVNLVLVKRSEQQKKERALGRLYERETSREEEAVSRGELIQTHESICQPKFPIAFETLFERQEKESRAPRKVLILGQAGIGKTTLCQYILQRWLYSCNTAGIVLCIEGGLSEMARAALAQGGVVYRLSHTEDEEEGDDDEWWLWRHTQENLGGEAVSIGAVTGLAALLRRGVTDKKELPLEPIKDALMAHHERQNKLPLWPYFCAVFWIKLGDIADYINEINKESLYGGEWLERLLVGTLKKQCLNSDPKLSYEILKSYLEQYHHKILFLLDGYDEVVASVENQSNAGLKQLIEEILNFQYVLVTSRPLQSNHLIQTFDFVPDRTLENIGFTTPNVNRYIKNYFHRYPKSKAQRLQLRKAIHNNPNLAEIVRVPIILEYICYEYNKEHTPITMTGLCQRITKWMLTRSPEEQKRLDAIDEDPERIGLQAIQAKMEEGLEILAFHALFAQQLTVTPELFGPLTEKYPQIASIQHRLFSSGFLRSIGGYYDESLNAHYFIHLTFMEFFAARFIVRWMKERQFTIENTVYSSSAAFLESCYGIKEKKGQQLVDFMKSEQRTLRWRKGFWKQETYRGSKESILAAALGEDEPKQVKAILLQLAEEAKSVVTQGVAYTSPSDFIQAHKQAPQYDFVWGFVAGLLRDPLALLNPFVDVLLTNQSSDDREMLLAIRCLHESQLAGIEQKECLLEAISQYVLRILLQPSRADQNRPKEDKRYRTLVSNLCHSPRVLYSPKRNIAHALLAKLENEPLDLTCRAIFSLAQLGVNHEAVLNKLLDLLAHPKEEVVRAAALALGELGQGKLRVHEGLLGLLEHQDEEVVQCATDALKKLGVYPSKGEEEEEEEEEGEEGSDDLLSPDDDSSNEDNTDGRAGTSQSFAKTASSDEGSQFKIFNTLATLNSKDGRCALNALGVTDEADFLRVIDAQIRADVQSQHLLAGEIRNADHHSQLPITPVFQELARQRHLRDEQRTTVTRLLIQINQALGLEGEEKLGERELYNRIEQGQTISPKLQPHQTKAFKEACEKVNQLNGQYEAYSKTPEVLQAYLHFLSGPEGYYGQFTIGVYCRAKNIRLRVWELRDGKLEKTRDIAPESPTARTIDVHYDGRARHFERMALVTAQNQRTEQAMPRFFPPAPEDMGVQHALLASAKEQRRQTPFRTEEAREEALREFQAQDSRHFGKGA